MHLRRFTSADLSDISTIMATCNKEDSLSLYLNREGTPVTHWTSYRASSVRWIRGELLRPGAICWVMVTDPEDRTATGICVDPDTIVGWALWLRTGTSETACTWLQQSEGGTTWSRWVERKLRALEGIYYSRWPGANVAIDNSHMREIMPILNAGWDKEVFAEAWILDAFFVDPDFQRKGLGANIVAWGLERGQEEGVPVLVAASPKGLPAYEKYGFRRLRKLDFDRFFDTGGDGVWELVWEPKGTQGQWLQRAIQNIEKREEERAEEAARKRAAAVTQRSNVADILKDYEVFHS